MMITGLQITCDGENCRLTYPERGSADGAIFTPFEVRKLAKKNSAWARIGGRDYCFSCAERMNRVAKALLDTYRKEARP